MSRALPWMKFYPSDWRSSEHLRNVSYAARGLWIECIALMHSAEPYGYLTFNGKPMPVSMIARLTTGDVSEVETLLAELEASGVFSRNKAGTIYSRRMVSDEKKARISRENGKKGGSPTLCKEKEIQAWDNPQDKGGVKPQIPEAREEKIEEKKEEGSEAKASGADAPSGGGPVLAVVDGEPTLEKVYWDAVTAAQATLPKGLPQSTFRAYRGLARRWLELHDGDVEAAIAEIENSATKANAFTWLKTCIDDRKAGAKIPQWKQKPPPGYTGTWNGTRYIRGCPMSSAAI